MKTINMILATLFCFVINAGEPDSVYVEKKDLSSITPISTRSSFANLSQDELKTSIDSIQEIVRLQQEKIATLKLEMRKYSKYYGFDSIPCKNLYKKWDISNTFNYSKMIWDKDSVIDLSKDDIKMEFAFPIQEKTEYKYHSTITSEYGEREGRPHEGVDVELHVNDSVYSCFSGVIRMSRTHGGYGRLVVVRHDNGLETLYGHLHRLKVKPGERVEPGQLIGLGGSSGHSTGSHLHFEMRYKGRSIDPEQIIDFDNKTLKYDQLTLRRNKKGYVAFEGGQKFHKVTKRESMYYICKRYGLYFKELRALNGLTENKRFANGDLVRIR